MWSQDRWGRTLILSFLFLLGLIVSSVKAEETKGTVIDKFTKRPILEARVEVPGTKIRAKTDTGGHFILRGLPKAETEIKIKAIGYEPKTVQVKTGEELKIELMPSLTIYGRELVVKAKKPESQKETIISKEIVTGKEVKTTSVDLFNDLSETLKTMPGVISSGDFEGQLYVRGSYPMETIFLLDRVFIAWPYHWGGNMALFNTKLIDRVDFYAGGFPAEAGNALGGVVDVTYKRGNREEFAAGVDLSPTTLDLQLEGPIKKDKSSYLLSFKRTHYDQVMEWLGMGEEGNVYPFFYDYLSRVSASLNPKDEISFYYLYSGEGMDMKMEEDFGSPDDEEGRFYYDYLKQIASLNYKHLFFDRLFNELTFSNLRDDGQFRFYSPTTPSEDIIDVNDYSLRDDLTLLYGENHEFKVGTYLYTSDMNFTSTFRYEEINDTNGGLTKETKEKSYESKDNFNYAGFYLWDKVKLTKPLTADMGLRYEYLDLTEEGVITPRLSLSYSLNERTSLKAGWGVYSQFVMDPYWFDDENGNPDLTAQKARHYILGFERKLKEDLRLRIETYYKDLYDLIIADEDKNYDNEGQGYAKGIEFFLQKKAGKKLDGWISYSIAESRRTKGVSSDSEEEYIKEETLYPTHQDITHALSVVANYRFSKKWRLALKFRYTSGSPYTRVVGAESGIFGDEIIYKPKMGDYMSERMPDYQRLDVTLSRQFSFKRWDLSAYLQLINLYNHKNIYGYYYSDDYQIRKEFKMFGFMPLGGVEVKF